MEEYTEVTHTIIFDEPECLATCFIITFLIVDGCPRIKFSSINKRDGNSTDQTLGDIDFKTFASKVLEAALNEKT